MTPISRRAFVGGTLGITLGGVLAACSRASGGATSSGGTAGGGAAALPKYIPLSSFKPNFASTRPLGVSAFLHYPANPGKATTRVPGDGKPITTFTQLNGAVPPPLGSNQYWQELNRRVGSPMDVQQLSAGPDFLTRLATMAAGGTLPDMMEIPPVPAPIAAFSQFMEAEMVDLTPYLAGDKISAYPNLANLPTEFWKDCVFDGSLRGIPIPRRVLGKCHDLPQGLGRRRHADRLRGLPVAVQGTDLGVS